MKTKYLLIGLDEKSICEDVGLSSTGLTNYQNHFVMGTLIDAYNDYIQAFEMAKNEYSKYELGCEIKTIFVKD